MVGMLIPCLEDDLLEPWKGSPKILELEAARSPGSPNLGEEEGAVIRERGRECMKDVAAKLIVPLRVAKERVELAKGRVFPLVLPRELSILEVDLHQPTTLERCTKTVKTPSVDVSLVFVTRSVNLVEIS